MSRPWHPPLFKLWITPGARLEMVTGKMLTGSSACGGNSAAFLWKWEPNSKVNVISSGSSIYVSFSAFPLVLVHPVPLPWNTWCWVIYKEQNFLSHSYRGWQVKDQDAGVCSGYSLFPWWHLECCALAWRKATVSSGRWQRQKGTKGP